MFPLFKCLFKKEIKSAPNVSFCPNLRGKSETLLGAKRDSVKKFQPFCSCTSSTLNSLRGPPRSLHEPSLCTPRPESRQNPALCCCKTPSRSNTDSLSLCCCFPLLNACTSLAYSANGGWIRSHASSSPLFAISMQNCIVVSWLSTSSAWFYEAMALKLLDSDFMAFVVFINFSIGEMSLKLTPVAVPSHRSTFMHGSGKVFPDRISPLSGGSRTH